MKNERILIHDFDLNLICDYFGRLERQGPGSIESTIRALSFIDNFSNKHYNYVNTLKTTILQYYIS